MLPLRLMHVAAAAKPTNPSNDGVFHHVLPFFARVKCAENWEHIGRRYDGNQWGSNSLEMALALPRFSLNNLQLPLPATQGLRGEAAGLFRQPENHLGQVHG